MHPILFETPLGIIMSYSFFYFVAIVITIVGVFVHAYYRGFAIFRISVFLGGVLISGLIGARMMHVFTHHTLYAEGNASIYSLHMENFAIAGGMLAAMCTGFVLTRIMRLDLWQLGDISALYLGIGIAVARIGCFLNGCCFGHETHVAWSVKYPALSYAHQYQIAHGTGSIFGTMPVHPTQMYELSAALFGSAIVYVCMKKFSVSGMGILFFGMWFGMFRFINSYFRVMPDTFDAPAKLYPMLYSGVIVLCAIVLFYRVKIKNTTRTR